MSGPSITGTPCDNSWPHLTCILFYQAFQRRLRLAMWYHSLRKELRWTWNLFRTICHMESSQARVPG